MNKTDHNIPEPGCYVDSHWGQFAMARAVQIAVEFGWDDAEGRDLAGRHLSAAGPSDAPGLTGDEFERLVFICDECEDWLNEYRTLDGYYWCWNDGDFGLYKLEDEG